MKQCTECNRPFEPREPYHKYCDKRSAFGYKENARRAP